MPGDRAEGQQIDTPRDQIVKSGIAEKMFATLPQMLGVQDAGITFSIHSCDFRVETSEDERTNQKLTSAVIEFPNPNPLNREKTPKVSLAFSVQDGKPFGLGKDPLTPEQFDLLMKLAK